MAYSASNVLRSWVPVSGVPTEVFTAAATAGGPAALQVLIIPGNPGNAGFYTTLMRQLHAALGGRADIVACSHAGHDTGPHNTGKQLWDLGEQIQHKAVFIRQHLLLPGRPPLVILAHSIGSYMAVHAVQQLEMAKHQLRQPSRHSCGAHQQVDRSQQQGEVTIAQGLKGNSPGFTVHAHAHGSSAWTRRGVDVCQASQHAGQHAQHAEHQAQHAQHAEHHTQVEAQHAAGLDVLQQRGSDLPLGPDSTHPLTGSHPHPQTVPPILKVVALMPFLQADFRAQWRQRALRTLARCYRVMSAVAGVLSALPLTLRLIVVNWWTRGSMDAEASRVTCELLHPHSVLNNFYLAKHEFADLARPFDWALLRQLGPRLHVLACPRDIWMSAQQFHHMLQQVPGLQASWHPRLQHAFCVSAKECEEVTHVVKGKISQALSQVGLGHTPARPSMPVVPADDLTGQEQQPQELQLSPASSLTATSSDASSTAAAASLCGTDSNCDDSVKVPGGPLADGHPVTTMSPPSVSQAWIRSRV